jgi:hypothetical protein
VFLTDPAERRDFIDSLSEYDLVVVDTLMANSTGDISNAGVMGEFVAAANLIRRKTGGAVLVLHHAGKDSTRGMIGSMRLDAALDVVARLALRPGGVRFVVERMRDGKPDLALALALRDVGVSAAMVADTDAPDAENTADSLLAAIYQANGACTAAALAKGLGYKSNGGIAYATGKLRKAGYLKKGGFDLTPAGLTYCRQHFGSAGRLVSVRDIVRTFFADDIADDVADAKEKTP